MGRTHRNRAKRERPDDKSVGQDGWQAGESSKDIELTNEPFENYYKAQGIVDESEWEDFMKSIRTPLPSTFRITGTRSEAFELRDLLKKRYFSKLEGLEIDGVKISVPTPLPWYPNELGWHFESSRSDIRKSLHFSDFHSFLVQETAQGNISRQEAVSMIPPIVLDVQPHHKVLDMCAAPGSKTSQLIEFLHTGCGDDIPTGVVIANDDSQERCYTLVHQIKRLKSPCTLVVNHDATMFPTMLIEKEGVAVPFQFDRILADVPCSGDATLRKNLMVWKKWSVTHGASLHGLQGRILRRGCQLLKVGGRIVYSTCSLNPLENEAVVANLLKEYPDVFELVDVSLVLPALKRNPGMSSWKVIDKNGVHLATPADLAPTHKGYLYPSMFPPTEAEARQMHLERCMRILPHHQNTGGFFIAVLQKKATMGRVDVRAARAEEAVKLRKAGVEVAASDAEELKDEKTPEQEEEADDRKKKATAKPKAEKPERTEAPFFFMEATHQNIVNIQQYFDLGNFPYHLLTARSENEKKRAIYYVSEGVREVMTAQNKDQLKIIHTGLKLFVRNEHMNDVGCDYRLGQEGIHVIKRYLRSQVIEVREEDFLVILNEDYPLFSSFSKPTVDALTQAKFGSVLFVFNPAVHGTTNCLLSNVVYVAGWRGKNSGAAMIDKQERVSLLHRFEGIDISESLIGEKKAKRARLDLEGDEDASDGGDDNQ